MAGKPLTDCYRSWDSTEGNASLLKSMKVRSDACLVPLSVIGRRVRTVSLTATHAGGSLAGMWGQSQPHLLWVIGRNIGQWQRLLLEGLWQECDLWEWCQPHLLEGHWQVPPRLLVGNWQVPTTPTGGPLAADSHIGQRVGHWPEGEDSDRVRTVTFTPVGGSLTEEWGL